MYVSLILVFAKYTFNKYNTKKGNKNLHLKLNNAKNTFIHQNNI